MSEDRDEPHGARYVFEMVKGKAVLKVAPGLARTPKNQGLFLLILITMVSIGSVFAGYWADTTYINPPVHVFGICAAPASLQSVGGVYGVGAHIDCVTTTAVTRIVNGQPQTVEAQVPAGTYQYLNGSQYRP